MTPDRMLDLFHGRSDAYGEQQPDGKWLALEGEVTTELMARHLDGKVTIGIYPLRAEDSRVRWGAIDVDVEDRAALDMLFEAAKVLGIRDDALLKEHSGHKGFHLWVFFADWVEAASVRRLLQQVAAASKIPHEVEVFPKQDAIPVDGYGNFVKLPLGTHRKTGKVAMPLDVSGPIEPLSPAELAEVLAPLPAVQPHPNGSAPAVGKKIRRGRRHDALRDERGHLRGRGYGDEAAYTALVAWGYDNLAELHDVDEPLEEHVRKMIESTSGWRRDPTLPPKIGGGTKAEPEDKNSGRPDKLQVEQTDPKVWLLYWPERGVLRLSTRELLDWGRVQSAHVEAFERTPRWVPRGRAYQQEWRDLVDELMGKMGPEDHIEPAPELTVKGRVLELLRLWCHRASEDPDAALDRQHGVWHDTQHERFVFPLSTLLTFCRSRYLSRDWDIPNRNEIAYAVRELGGEISKTVYRPDTKESMSGLTWVPVAVVFPEEGVVP